MSGVWSGGTSTPILPVSTMDRSADFYRAIGCTVERYSGGRYAFVRAGGISIDLSQTTDFDPFTMAGMAYLTVRNPDAVHALVVGTGLVLTGGSLTTADLRVRWTKGESLARVAAPEDKPWGMREFALLDPDNNLIRIGRSVR